MRWHKFKRVMPRGRGFYVLRYRGYVGDHRPDRPVYLATRADTDSYWVVSENLGVPESCHDLGHCIWPLGCSGYPPTHWRNMGPTEALRFSRKLNWFKGRNALTTASTVIYNRG